MGQTSARARRRSMPNATAVSSAAPLRTAVVIAGQLRTLHRAPVYHNIHASLVAHLRADVFVGITATDDADTEAAVARRLSGAFAVLKPINWTLVPTATARGFRDSRIALGCGTNGEHLVSQWVTTAEAFRLLVAHEAASGSSYNAIIRTRTDVVFERYVPEEHVRFATAVPWRVFIYCVLLESRTHAVDAALRPTVPRVYQVCPGQDGFAVMHREAAAAYFGTLSQYDCTSSFKRRRFCHSRMTAGANRSEVDCLHDSRLWCNAFISKWGNSLGSSECRLSQQLRENALCPCTPRTVVSIRMWFTTEAPEHPSDPNSSMTVWLQGAGGARADLYRKMIGSGEFLQGQPLLPLSLQPPTQDAPALSGPRCCLKLERPETEAASRPEEHYLNLS